MSELIDLNGKKFGKLTVVKRVENNKHRQPQWLCKCDCGNETIVSGQKLRTGHTKSCGCIIFEQKTRLKHGMTNTSLFTRWMNMKSRCYNPKNKRYSRYGARGITICDEWMDFSNFYNWAMQNGFKESLTLDRIDNDNGYCPENCRWATQKQQSNNKSTNSIFEINGEKNTLSEWCDKNFDILTNGREMSKTSVYKIVHSRMLKNNWDVEKALFTPIKKR